VSRTFINQGRVRKLEKVAPAPVSWRGGRVFKKRAARRLLVVRRRAKVRAGLFLS
jgi:hypothetical protein